MSYTLPREASAEKARILSGAHEHVIPGRVTVFNGLGIDLVAGAARGLPVLGYRQPGISRLPPERQHLHARSSRPGALGVLRQSLGTLDRQNLPLSSAAHSRARQP
jgi:hypothetical protein